MRVRCWLWHIQSLRGDVQRLKRYSPWDSRLCWLKPSTRMWCVECGHGQEKPEGAPALKVDWRKARFIREGVEPADGSALVSWAVSERRTAKAMDDEMEGGP